MSWFGPKGISTMTFALLVLSDQVAAGSRIFNLAALTVFCSIIAHGLTDTPGAEWIARRAERGRRTPSVTVGEKRAAPSGRSPNRSVQRR